MPHGYFSFPKVIRGSVRQALAEVCAEQRYALHGVPHAGPDRAAATPLIVGVAGRRRHTGSGCVPAGAEIGTRCHSTPPRHGVDVTAGRFEIAGPLLQVLLHRLHACGPTASSAFWPNSRFARRCRNRSQH